MSDMTLASILSALAEHPERCGFVVNMPAKTRCEPQEVWIEPIGCWMRADGFSASFDRGRGCVYYGPIERWRIRRAVARFSPTPAIAGRP